MGRSISCFKIITCSSDSADNDDLDVAENKGSNDKRGWSFRKRSARHRVLSNSVISEKENLESTQKENLDSTDVSFQPPNIANVPEKIPMIPPSDEKPQLSNPVELEAQASETIVETDAESKDDFALEESVVIVIQTAVRGFLAKLELLKLKNVVKLQATVRGHLVRRHAVGTLRCVQAIVKMQVLVRARLNHLEKEVNGKDEKDTHNSVTSKKGSSITKPNAAGTSIENLLSNGFARQLMASTPKNKPIHVKCDPAKRDSAWNWLERWMSVSVTKQTPEVESRIRQPENEKNENFTSSLETEMPSDVLSDPEETKLNVKETVVPSESGENLITYDTDKFSFQQSQLTFLLRDDLELSQPEKTTSDVNEISIEINSHQNQITQSDASSEQEPKSLPNKPEMESEQPKRSMKRLASENLKTEGNEFICGSRKSSNTTFIAAQTKFEELSLSAMPVRSISSQHQDISVDLNFETISSGPDTLTRTKDLSIAENSVSRIQYGGSECGTELSISSTLDSPDRSEVVTTEYEHETKVAEKEVCDPNNSNNSDANASDASTIPICVVSNSVVDRFEKVDGVQAESANSVVVIDTPQVERKLKSGASEMYKEREPETGHQTYRSSPEASPRSHITVPESQGTPLSQVSVKAKGNRTNKSGSNRKRKPLSASKGSPSNPNHDSGARSSSEQLRIDQKSGKRRNSFGLLKTDNIDQEPGDHSSSNSLPHFMQATESARAKIQANNSPQSSPDVQDRNVYVKKRHSLPVGNGRLGSPRIQQSASQAQQGAKGSGTQALHERKWQR